MKILCQLMVCVISCKVKVNQCVRYAHSYLDLAVREKPLLTTPAQSGERNIETN